jgi:hypothetical protein
MIKEVGVKITNFSKKISKGALFWIYSGYNLARVLNIHKC